MQFEEEEEVIFQIALSELAPVVPDRTSSWNLMLSNSNFGHLVICHHCQKHSHPQNAFL